MTGWKSQKAGPHQHAYIVIFFKNKDEKYREHFFSLEEGLYSKVMQIEILLNLPVIPTFLYNCQVKQLGNSVRPYTC